MNDVVYHVNEMDVYDILDHDIHLVLQQDLFPVLLVLQFLALDHNSHPDDLGVYTNSIVLPSLEVFNGPLPTFARFIQDQPRTLYLDNWEPLYKLITDEASYCPSLHHLQLDMLHFCLCNMPNHLWQTRSQENPFPPEMESDFESEEGDEHGITTFYNEAGSPSILEDEEQSGFSAFTGLQDVPYCLKTLTLLLPALSALFQNVRRIDWDVMETLITRDCQVRDLNFVTFHIMSLII